MRSVCVSVKRTAAVHGSDRVHQQRRGVQHLQPRTLTDVLGNIGEVGGKYPVELPFLIKLVKRLRVLGK